MKTCLSISGGGFMGIGPAMYLTLLERKINTLNIAYKFDSMAGTSTGAIIVALLSCGYSASEVLSIYEENLEKIFSRSWVNRITPWGSKYDIKIVQSMLDKYLGNVRFKDLRCPLFIGSYNARKRKAKIFDIGDKDTLVSEAVRCSLSAPTYFDPFKNSLVDGGLVANDPTLIGMAGTAKYYFEKAHEVRILSLVTGGQTDVNKPVSGSWTAIQWLPTLISSLTVGNSSDVDFIAKSVMGENYLSICPKTPDYELDQVEKAGAVKKIWKDEFALNHEKVSKWLAGS